MNMRESCFGGMVLTVGRLVINKYLVESETGFNTVLTVNLI